MSQKAQLKPRIPSLRRDLDEFKKEVDQMCFEDIPKLGTASPDRMNVYKRAGTMMKQLDVLRERFDSLSLNQEGITSRKFERYKLEEQGRLSRLQKQLEEVTQQLEPDEIEEDYFRRIQEDEPTDEDDLAENDGNDDEDEGEYDPEDEYESEELEYEDDDDDETEDKTTKVTNDKTLFMVEALCDFQAEQDGDLDFETGDHIAIIEQSEDGWWTGKDANGNTGLVPSTLVKVVQSEIVKNDIKGSKTLTKQQSGKDLWDKLKTTSNLNTSQKTSVSEVLQAMKAVPSGFRSPTLGSFFQKVEYRTSSWIIPKTSASNVNFKDLFWDPVNRKLRTRNVSTCRTLSVTSARFVPLPGVGVEVLSRHIYIALWDEEKILSNIHLVRGIFSEKDNSWTFNLKIGKNPASLYDGDIVVRSTSDDRKISVLMELNYTYLRTSTGDQSDISCGWASVPLYEADGTPVGNKTFEIHLNGGTPFDRNIPLDQSLAEQPPQNLMQSLVRSNRQPRIFVKTTSYNRLSKDTFDMLPDCIVTCQKYSRFIGLYRQYAASIYSKEDTIPTGLLCDSILSYFPRTLDYPDLMDALAISWDVKTRLALNRSQRRSQPHLQNAFQQCFKESVLALMHSSQLPAYKWGNAQVEQARISFIQNYLQPTDLLVNLLSPDYKFKPININRLSFDVTSKFSQEPLNITKQSATSVT